MPVRTSLMTVDALFWSFGVGGTLMDAIVVDPPLADLAHPTLRSGLPISISIHPKATTGTGASVQRTLDYWIEGSDLLHLGFAGARGERRFVFFTDAMSLILPATR